MSSIPKGVRSSVVSADAY